MKFKYNRKSTEENKTNLFIAPKPIIQKKLEIGRVDDTYEVEANHIADMVINTPESHLKTSSKGGLIQRKCAACEEERVHKKSFAENITPIIQRKTTSSEGGEVSNSINSRINSSRGSGHKMSKSTQSFMESRFGTDFSDVRIHTDANAKQLSKEMNAQAFTVGNDIYFNEGKYNPVSIPGRHLLAHELTHTIQQSGHLNLKIQREMVQDRDGKLKYKTKEEAQSRLNKMIRITPNPKKSGEYFIEWRWNPTNPAEDPWSTGTVSRSKKAAEQKLNTLMRVTGKDSEWYVIKDTSLMPDDTEKEKQRKEKPKTSTTEEKEEKSSSSQVTNPTFALTFDDGPHVSALGKGNNRTENVMNVLKDEGIKAAFFVQTGVSYRGAHKVGKELVKRMFDQKHTVAIHTGGKKDHELHTTAAKKGTLEKELLNAKKYVKDVTGQKATFVRPPTGAHNKQVDAIYDKVKLKNLMWDIDGDAGTSLPLKTLKARLDNQLQKAKNNNWKPWDQNASSKIVVLYHDVQENTAKYIKVLISYIRKKVKDLGGGTAKFDKP